VLKTENYSLVQICEKMSDDGKDEKKKDGEEEEELDCSHPEVVNKYQQAGAVANGVNHNKILCDGPCCYV
jgi:hypothetical protein